MYEETETISRRERIVHDDVMKWHSPYWPFVEGKRTLMGPHKLPSHDSKWQVTPLGHFVLALKLLYEERSQSMWDASNRLLNIPNIFIHSPWMMEILGSIFIKRYIPEHSTVNL